MDPESACVGAFVCWREDKKDKEEEGDLARDSVEQGHSEWEREWR